MLAKAVLGAFLFLLVASFLVMPCLTADPGFFSSVAAPLSCQEHKMFKAQADLSKLELLPAEGVSRFPVALPAIFAASVLVRAVLAAAHARLRGSIRAMTGTLPFVTEDPPRLPAFAALRDA